MVGLRLTQGGFGVGVRQGGLGLLYAGWRKGGLGLLYAGLGLMSGR